MNSAKTYPQTHPAVQVSEAVFAYDTKGSTVLNGVNLDIAPGEFAVLLGRSGTGKSTLLRLMNGFVRPQRGAVSIEGKRLGYSSKELRTVRKNIGVIYQQHNLVGRLSVTKNVMSGMLANIPLGRALLGIFNEREKNLSDQLLAEVGLKGFGTTRADQLSGGQKQRVAIARALAQDPQILLADEPVASLDPITAREILSLLDRIRNNRGITVVITLHQIELAREFGDRIIALADGEIVVATPSSELSDEHLAAIYPSSGSATKKEKQ
ncbi:phosphonate ABC transporter ATP-binding protein [Corynebacterium appendicis]|uniref:phosphonate ABC transporter ATP-binding protein n=1 Tax=Corynebacterium appendicis TaxID=163202 RepID=UPI0021B056BF|nr:phosphonate ABC transporter ATP-binding protein [Corynebacterium appendicis]MCT1685228.1 phosphonate ABC transporter ATP-binding protein [Corynebacterium appendicis]